MESNGQGQQVQVNMQVVVGKLTEQIARLTYELAMTQAALEQALQENGVKIDGNAGSSIESDAGATRAER